MSLMMVQDIGTARATIIGAGPAGLMAADILSAAGVAVDIHDQMPSPARKFLMAGKSGLNITKIEDRARFMAAFGDAPLRSMLDAFGPDDVVQWMADLGQDSFTGSTGRVFPTAMKASPLLRAWLSRLDGQGVRLHRRSRWTGWDGAVLTFADGQRVTPDITILALGGASWRRLGSDGTWAGEASLAPLTAPFEPSNAGLSVAWSAHMARHFGTPLKNIRLSAGQLTNRGEVVLSAKGIEGGGLYPLTPALRTGSPLMLDLKPDLSEDDVRKKLTGRGKASLSQHLRKALRLPPAAIALLQEIARPLPDDLAPLIKALPIRGAELRPMDEAISTAGGLRFEALTDDLMIRSRPGTFVAGEMLDWEAPTGGYLLTACLAMGRWAALGALRRLETK